MFRGLVIGLMFFAAAPVAWAQDTIVSEHADKVAVTVYPQDYGIALISETRTVDLPAGPAVIEFHDVTSTMVTATADVSGLPDKVDERNFDFNLLSPASLIQKSIDQPVRLVRTNRQTGVAQDESAIIRTGPQGLMLQIGDTFEALKCSGLPERLVFDHVPDGLYDTPTLTVRTNIPKAGRYTLTLRYIATGLSWSADYVAHVATDDSTLDLSGWITLENYSETSFRDAPVSVIAGRLQATGDDNPTPLPNIARGDLCWPTNINWASYYATAQTTQQLLSIIGGNETVFVTGTSIRGEAPVGANVISVDRNIVARDLGDYKLYPLPEPTTVAAQETKQIQFLDKNALPFRRIYRYDNSGDLSATPGQDNILPSSILLRLQNTEAGGLGRPLPAGGVSAMATYEGSPILLSDKKTVNDTPIGLPVEVPAGSTTDVFAQARLVTSTSYWDVSHMRRRDTIEVTVTNGKSNAVTFEWAQQMYSGNTFVSETGAHENKNGAYVWTIPLKSGEKAVFQYTMDGP